MRWFQFRLRSLFLLATAVAVICWVAVSVPYQIKIGEYEMKSTLPLMASDGSRFGTIGRHVDIYAVNPTFVFLVWAAALTLVGGIAWTTFRWISASRQK